MAVNRLNKKQILIVWINRLLFFNHKRKELKLWAKTWINIENNMLNEVNQSKKTHYVIPHI